MQVKQNNEGVYPQPGELWRHYKGGIYKIVAMCNHTDTDEILVIYKSVSFGGFHARPYSEWHDQFPPEPDAPWYIKDYPVTRFSKLS